jgi:hypothetical protein
MKSCTIAKKENKKGQDTKKLSTKYYRENK